MARAVLEFPERFGIAGHKLNACTAFRDHGLT